MKVEKCRLVLITFLMASVILVAQGSVAAAAASSRPHLTVDPAGTLTPHFRWKVADYAVRCGGSRADVSVKGAKGWRARTGSGDYRRGSFTAPLAADGKRTSVSFRRQGAKSVTRFNLRCLPEDFPNYEFSRVAAGGPSFFVIQLGKHYAAIFNRDGVPVWWYRASGEPDNAQILPDGTIAFDPVDEATFQTGNYEIRTLKGRLLRTIRGANGSTADVHEIQLLPNGNYLIGAQQTYPADTSAYGGSANSSAIGIVIQELTPAGKVVWSWKSEDHIDLAETGRWWDRTDLDPDPYDVVHWNSAEPVGKKFMILSFRHLDAVYEINRKTGDIVWKLGGTPTPESLDVRNDPLGDYPLGGQHDARIQPDGTITVHDNGTGLGRPPRAVRYRIDPAKGTARLVQSIEEPEVPSSFCCGSARRIDGGDWLIGWGGVGLIGGYDAAGDRLFDLQLDVGFSYRANPVADGLVTSRDLRKAMDAIVKR